MAIQNIQIQKIEDIANIILVNRKKSKLSRDKLALLSGVGKTAIYNIEHGKITYQIDTLLKIFEVLNIKIYINAPFNE
ncbi:MAG TPA: helix-turn-helix domain-containing protein [Melioribacteraceae bacterium]|nr:helix-turn-helix domain-containing protein [Melioribacteraceae bacterium]